MTNTQIITAGALVAAGSDLSNATKVTLNGATRKFTLEARVTYGAIPGQDIQPVALRFATSNVDGTAAAQAAILELMSAAKTCKIKTEKGAATHFYSVPFVPTGAILYVWASHPGLPADAVLDVWLNEDVGAAGSASAPSIVTPASKTYTDRSGTIVAGATSQAVAAANAARTYLLFQNHSDTDMWLNFGVAAVATQPSILIPANGGFYEPLVPSNQTVNVICATIAKAYTCKEA